MAEPVAIQKFVDADLDVDTLEAAVNEDKIITARLGREYASVPMASRLLVENGLLGATPFSTYTALTASALVDGDYAVVTNDVDLSKNGIYQKTSGTWVFNKYNSAAKIDNLTVNKTNLGWYLGTVYETDVDISTITTNGVHLLSTTVQTGVPQAAKDYAALLALEVKRYGSYLTQKLYVYNAPATFWQRTGKIGSMPAFSDYQALGKQNYLTADIDVNTLKKDGQHLLAATVITNVPDALKNAIKMIDVKTYGSFLKQTLTTTDGSTYLRTGRTNSNTFTDWIKAPSATAIASNNLKGKTVVGLGDSVMEFGNQLALIGAQYDCNTVNCGVGGTRISKHPDLGYDKMSGTRIAKAINTGDWTQVVAGAIDVNNREADDNRPAINLLENMNWIDVDYIVVNYGTNDWLGGEPLGNANDYTADGATIAGSTNYFIDMILAEYPHIKILFLTPIARNRNGIDARFNANANGVTLADIADITIDICHQRWGVNTFDQLRQLPINKNTYALYLKVDGTHPTDAGYQLIATAVGAKLNAI